MKILKKWSQWRKQYKLKKIIQYFMEGNYDATKKLLKVLEGERIGDVAAIKILVNTSPNDNIEQLREIYDGLWNVKCFKFTNDAIGQMVDAKLEAITPTIMEYATEDISEIYKLYLDNEWENMFRSCKVHVCYGHPDAIVLQILGYMKFGFDKYYQSETSSYYARNMYYYNEKFAYTECLYDLKKAMQRGISKEYKEQAIELMKQLEILSPPEIIDYPTTGIEKYCGWDGYGDF